MAVVNIPKIHTEEISLSGRWRSVVLCPAAESATLDFLRTTHQTCRTKPRQDLFVACELLTCDRHAETSNYAEAIIRALPHSLGRRPIILRPGDAVVTFDESWLLAILRACGNGEDDNLNFLLSSRIKKSHRPNILFLITNLTRLTKIN